MNDKERLLLARLIERTQSGKIDWQENLRAKSFVVHFPGLSVHLSSDANEGYQLYVRDDRANYVTYIDEQTSEESASQLEKLYKLASEHVYRREEKLDALLRELS